MIAQHADALANKLARWKGCLGKLTLACGIGMVAVGFPAQIYTNYQAHACQINPVLVAVALALYAIRIPYQISAKAWYLLPADVLGVLASSILMAQYIAY